MRRLDVIAQRRGNLLAEIAASRESLREAASSVRGGVTLSLMGLAAGKLIARRPWWGIALTGAVAAWRWWRVPQRAGQRPG